MHGLVEQRSCSALHRVGCQVDAALATVAVALQWSRQPPVAAASGSGRSSPVVADETMTATVASRPTEPLQQSP